MNEDYPMRLLGARRLFNGELLARCFRPENHRNGDAHPSMSINVEKATWYCHAEGVGGKLSEIPGCENVSAISTQPKVLSRNQGSVALDVHNVTPAQKESLIAGGRYFPNALSMLNAKCVHLGSKSGIGLQTLKGNYAVLGIAHDGEVRRSEDGKIEKRHWPGGCGSSVIASPELFTGNYAEVIVLAGEWDLMAAIENGILNVVAGTAGEGSPKPFMEHADFFKRFEELTVIYDRDPAGVGGARKLALALSEALGSSNAPAEIQNR